MTILECKSLTKSYGDVRALDGVDITIEPGRIVGLLGPNGSGKTTLIKLANGLLVPSGAAMIDIILIFLTPRFLIAVMASAAEPPVASMGSTTNTVLSSIPSGSLQ